MKNIILYLLGRCLNVLSYIAPGKAAKLGFSIFCYPYRPPLSAKHKSFLATAEKSTFVYKGISIQTYRWGSGPKNVLLLHGWQSHTYRWKRYIESLSKTDFTIHAFDAPGHGLSSGRFLHVPLYSEVIANFITRIGSIETIISHSIGSFALLYAFHQHQHLSSKNVVSLASPGEVQEFLDLYKKSLKLSTRCMNLITIRFEQLFQKSPRDFSAHIFASSLNTPGLIIHDEEDGEAPVAHSRRIHAAWLNSTFIMTRGLGHNLRSEDVVKEVIKFVNQRSAAVFC